MHKLCTVYATAFLNVDMCKSRLSSYWDDDEGEAGDEDDDDDMPLVVSVRPSTHPWLEQCS